MIRIFCVFFLLSCLVVLDATSQENEWAQIKNHGPHAGFVKMNKSKSWGIEVLSKDNGLFEVHPLAANFGPIEASDLKMSVKHNRDTKKEFHCVQKDTFLNCQIIPASNEGELLFKMTSKKSKIDELYIIALPIPR